MDPRLTTRQSVPMAACARHRTFIRSATLMLAAGAALGGASASAGSPALRATAAAGPAAAAQAASAIAPMSAAPGAQHTSASSAATSAETPAATVATAPAAAPASTTSTHPCTLWTDEQNDEVLTSESVQVGPVATTIPVPAPYDPSLDLTKGAMEISGSNLVARLYVTDLEKQVSAGLGGISWSADWTFAGSEYRAWATYSSSGGTFFSVSSGSASTESHPATGRLVTGPGGYAEIDIPLAEVGGPAAGAVLSTPIGNSFRDVGDVSAVNGQPTVVEMGADTGGPGNNYVVGSGCG